MRSFYLNDFYLFKGNNVAHPFLHPSQPSIFQPNAVRIAQPSPIEPGILAIGVVRDLHFLVQQDGEDRGMQPRRINGAMPPDEGNALLDQQPAADLVKEQVAELDDRIRDPPNAPLASRFAAPA